MSRMSAYNSPLLLGVDLFVRVQVRVAHRQGDG